MNLDFSVKLPEFPDIQLPGALDLPIPTLELPRGEIPSYKPLVLPPSDLRPPPGIQGTTPSEEAEKETPKPKPQIKPPKPPEINYIDIPFVDEPVPVPTGEILATAGTTAFVSVAVTLTATSLFKKLVTIFKPIIKKILSKKNGGQDEGVSE